MDIEMDRISGSGNDGLKTIAVLMSSFNGEKYICGQINSILRQKNVIVSLYIRDDGSTDKTIAILNKYSSNKNIHVIKGRNIGVGNSFWELLSYAKKYDYFAWSDQDDIWDDDKLCIAIDMLKENSNEMPLLYFSNNVLVDKNLKTIAQNGKDVSKPSASRCHAFIGSTAQGATMVFNQALYEIAVRYTPRFKELNLFHDAWLHKLCIVVGGKVIFDPCAHICYRIHESNVVARIPEKKSIIKRIKNMFYMRRKNFYSEVAKELIDGYDNLISDKLKKEIVLMAYYRDSINTKFKLIFSKEIKTGKMKKDMIFIFHVLFGKA